MRLLLKIVSDGTKAAWRAFMRMNCARTRTAGFLLAVLSLFLWAASASAATNFAASTAFEDVSNAVYQSRSGDTVRVPAGGANWTNFLFMKVGVNLIGAGTNASFITNSIPAANSWDPGNWPHPPLFRVGLTNGYSFRISGFNFNGNWTAGGPALMILGYPDAPNTITNYRVDHCLFNLFPGGGSYFSTIHVWRQAYGVVDHCSFIDCSYALMVFGTFNSDWSVYPAPYYTLGSSSNTVVEDCLIATTRPSYAKFGISSAWAAHYVFRNNVVSNSFAGTLQEVLDLHGNKSCDGSIRGALAAEIYGNKFYLASDAYRIAYLRGGTCMVFSNQVFSTYSAAGSIVIDEEEAWPGSDLSLDPICGGVNTNWPGIDQITNSFFWANTCSAPGYTYPTLPPQLQASAPGFFQEGRDYWTHAPNSTNVLKDYKPLPYPHPRVAAEDGSPSVTLTTAVSSFPSTSGSISAPFVTNADATISQPVQTVDPTSGGRAGYTFTVPTNGSYVVAVNVFAPAVGANSLFVNVDTEPAATMIWDVAPYQGFRNQIVTWRGPVVSQKAWALAAGTHQLVIRGRDASVKIGAISIVPTPPPPRNCLVLK